MPQPVTDEYLLLGNATRGSGEPMVAVDPVNSENIIAVGMGSMQILPGFKAPVTAGMTDKYHEVKRSTITWLGVSHDGGTTWKVSELPIITSPSGNFDRCPDPFAGVTKTGVFIAGCEPRHAVAPFFGESATVVSTDHGETWSTRADGVNSFNKEPFPKFAPSLKPRMGGNSPWDRPFLTVDDLTGTVYLGNSGGETAANPGSGSEWRTQSYFTASHDDGRSWGTIYADDDPQWPQLGRASIAAGHGKLAQIYVASSVPSTANAKCPCQVFGISSDEGRTFDRHIMKHIQVRTAKQSFGERTFTTTLGSVSDLTADPTTSGRYSVLRYVTGGSPHYQISTSNDSGRTWSEFVDIQNTSGARYLTKPWLEYSRFGVLGIEWRAIYPDFSYDVWAAISKDGGKTFSDPLRISHQKSPPSNYYRNAGNFGDDVQHFSMSRTHMYLVWGDYRAGFLGTWMGSAALSSFRFN